MFTITIGCFAMLISGLALSILGLIALIVAIKEVIIDGFDVMDGCDIALTFLSLVILIAGIILILTGTGILVIA